MAWSGSLNEAPWNGLFFWNGTRPVPVLLEGVPHPPSGLDVYQFGQRVELEDSGRILFDAGSNDLGAYGLFTAMPVEVVPALPAAGRLVLTLALAAAGALGVRRIRR